MSLRIQWFRMEKDDLKHFAVCYVYWMAFAWFCTSLTTLHINIWLAMALFAAAFYPQFFLYKCRSVEHYLRIVKIWTVILFVVSFAILKLTVFH